MRVAIRGILAAVQQDAPEIWLVGAHSEAAQERLCSLGYRAQPRSLAQLDAREWETLPAALGVCAHERDAAAAVVAGVRSRLPQVAVPTFIWGQPRSLLTALELGVDEVIPEGVSDCDLQSMMVSVAGPARAAQGADFGRLAASGPLGSRSILEHGREVACAEVAARVDAEDALMAAPSAAALFADFGALTEVNVRAADADTDVTVEESGNLVDTPVPRLLWSLCERGFSGRLTLQRGRAEKHIWYRQGNIVFARSNVANDRFVEALLRRGQVTREQYDRVREIAAQDSRRVGEILLHMGLLRPAELPRALQQQLQRIVDSTFVWHEGAFTLHAGERCDESIVLQVSVPRIIMEGIRSRLDASWLVDRLNPSARVRLRRDGPIPLAELGTELGLLAAEEELLTRFTGENSVEDILADLSVDETELLGLVYALGIFAVLEHARDATAAGVGEADMLDARIRERLRMCRQSDYFELLGLPHTAHTADVRRAQRELLAAFADDAFPTEVCTRQAQALGEIRRAIADAATVLARDAWRVAYLAHVEER